MKQHKEKCPECESLWVNHTVAQVKVCGQRWALKKVMEELDKID